MLTTRQVERKHVPGRYRCGLVRGLYLQVGEGHAKSWILRYQLHGQSREMGLGSAHEFSLKEVRERARVARQFLADGRDPIVVKHADQEAARIAARHDLTFIAATEQYLTENEHRWRNERGQFRRTLATYAFPIIGKMSVAAIDTPDVLNVLRPIWATKTVTASRVRGRIERILDWATVSGHRPVGPNPARWKGHLSQVLPPPRQVAPIVNHRAMPYRDVGNFMIALRAQDDVAARALEILILTAARTSEILDAPWSEIDLVEKAWTIPAARMKSKREHRVPLCAAAVKLLGALPRDESGLVFGALNRMSLVAVMAKLGQDGKATAHGFRSTFRDWAGETTAFPHDVCEAALAHTRGDETVKAYARGDLFEKRRALMETWAKYCAAPIVEISATVVPLHGA